MIYYESIAGNPYMTYEALAERWGMHRDTVRNRVKEIMNEIEAKRYPRKSIIVDEKIVRVNEFVFFDYESNRARLRNKATRKYVERFDATECAVLLGFHNRPVKVDE